MFIAHTQRHRDWDGNVAETAFAMHNTVNRSTGFAPCFLNLRRELPFSQENALASREESGGQCSFCELAVNLRKRFGAGGPPWLVLPDVGRATRMSSMPQELIYTV